MTTFNRSEMEGEIRLSSDGKLVVSTVYITMTMIVDVITTVLTFAVLMLCWGLLKQWTSRPPANGSTSQRLSQRRFADVVCVV